MNWTSLAVEVQNLFWCMVTTTVAGSIPVEDELCRKMIKEYQKKFHLSHVVFYQNDSILFPMCAGSVEPQIILPVRSYCEKELHMVLEHELSHVKHQDLLWKKIGLMVTFIHWWNPFSYILLRQLILQEEIECDIRTCENNRHFTMKEYGYYLAGIPEDENDMVVASALSKSKRDLIRRLEGMTRGKEYTKRMAVASCMMLSMLEMILPSYAASESMAQMNERWIEETTIERELEY